MAPPTVTLDYEIQKNLTKSIAAQLAEFSSLVLYVNGTEELLFLQLEVANPGDDTTIDTIPGNPDAPLLRRIKLSEVVPDFVNDFGPSEDPTTWGLQSLWQNRIAIALATPCSIP